MTASGHLLVANIYANAVAEYVPGSVYPVAVISGPNTGLDFPDGVDVDTQGRIYVANQYGDSVTVYSPGANGNVAPVATIAGPATGISAPTGLAFTPPLSVLTSRLPRGHAGRPYRAELSAGEGTTPYRWSLAAGRLPAGLTLRPDGTISGRPLRAGEARFSVRVTDSSRPHTAARRRLELRVG